MKPALFHVISRFVLIALPLVSAQLVSAQTDEWEPVSGAETLRGFMSGLKTERDMPGREVNRADYNADGTGTLYAWGETFPRTWEIRGEDQICISDRRSTGCYRIERSTSTEDLYRVIDAATGQATNFRVTSEVAIVTDPPNTAGSSGSAGTASADELAAKLANPTSPVMTIGNNFDYIKFDGDLPGASDQDAVRYVFQTVFPYKLDDGGSVFFRPGIPVIFNDPVPNAEGGYDSLGTDLGDTGFDLSYGKTEQSGLLWGGGIVGTIPTATNDLLGKDRWAMGPEVLLGLIKPGGLIGGVLSHQWDFAGSGDAEINLTSLNYFYGIFLKQGWIITAGPTITYDHTKDSEDAWTVPLGIGISKTAVLAGRPWKFQLQYWNYVEAADAFAPKHQLRLSINPVVAAPWNEGR